MAWHRLVVNDGSGLGKCSDRRLSGPPHINSLSVSTINPDSRVIAFERTKATGDGTFAASPARPFLAHAVCTSGAMIASLPTMLASSGAMPNTQLAPTHRTCALRVRASAWLPWTRSHKCFFFPLGMDGTQEGIIWAASEHVQSAFLSPTLAQSHRCISTQYRMAQLGLAERVFWGGHSFRTSRSLLRNEPRGIRKQ